MATSADEFDPPSSFLDALCQEVLVPVLEKLGRESDVSFRAKVAVWVRDKEIPKFLLLPGGGRGEFDLDENVLVRVRFRKTYREERILFSAETQHAEVWRTHGFSGVRCHGDIIIDGERLTVRRRSKTICYNLGWIGW